MRLTAVGLRGRERADDSVRRAVLRHRVRGKRDERRRLVHVRDGDREVLVAEEGRRAVVRRAHGDVVAARALEVEGCAGPQRVAADVEVRAAGLHRVGVRLAAVRLRRGKGPDDGVRREVFRHRVRRERDEGRRLIHVGHVDGEVLVAEECRRAIVGRAHGDVVAVRALEVEGCAGPQRVAADVEVSAAGLHRVGVRLPAVWLRRGKRAHDGVRREVLRNRVRREGDEGWGLVHIGDRDGEVLVVEQGRRSVVRRADRDVVGVGALEVERGARAE